MKVQQSTSDSSIINGHSLYSWPCVLWILIDYVDIIPVQRKFKHKVNINIYIVDNYCPQSH